MTDITEINKKIKDQLNWIEEDYNVDLWRDCFEITKLCLEHTIRTLDLLDIHIQDQYDRRTILNTKNEYQKQLEQLKLEIMSDYFKEDLEITDRETIAVWFVFLIVLALFIWGAIVGVKWLIN